MSDHEVDVADILALVSLPAIISRNVELSIEPEGRRGSCLWHPDPSRSLYVDAEGRFFHCFSCGCHGDALRWIMKRDGLDQEAALRLLANSAGAARQSPHH